MKGRREFTISRWWLLPFFGAGVIAWLYAQSLGWPAWVCFICATCAGGLFTISPYVILVFYAAWKAEKNKTGRPYDVP